MTVSNPLNYVAINGDGVTTVFSFTFPLPVGSTGSDLYYFVVDNNGVLWPITSNYSLNLGAQQVTYPVTGGISPVPVGDTALPVGYTFLIYRIETLTQALNLATQGPFPAAGIMAALDYLTMIAQQLQEQINRCVQVQIGQSQSTSQMFSPLNYVKGTYAYCKAMAAQNPTAPFLAIVTDQGTPGALLPFWYCGDTAVGDGGFQEIAGG